MKKALLNRFICKFCLVGLGIIGFVLSAMAAQAESASPTDTWNIESGQIDPKQYFGETIANGMIGMRTMSVPFRTEQTLINGAYEMLSPGYVSSLASGFDFLNVAFSIDGERIERIDQVTNFRQRLQMKDAAFTSRFDFRDKASVIYTLRTLQHLPYTALLEVSVTAKRLIVISPKALLDTPRASASNPNDVPTRLTDIQAYDQSLELTKTPPTLLRIRAASAQSQFGSHTIAAAQGFAFDEPPAAAPIIMPDKEGLAFTKQLAAGTTYHFALVGSTITTAQVRDPLNEAQRLTTFAVIQGTRDLIARHDAAWAELWKSDIRIEGDDEAQRDVHSMLFHLYSSARAGTAYSIAPMGLSRSTHGYLGHIFCDADLGMLPTLAALQPKIAKSILEYRFQRLDAARHNAAAHGYEGAMFPWESAATGDEETPTTSLGGALEHMVTGAVGIAAWDYYRITQDQDWLRDKGYPLIKETADFWASRVTRSVAGQYDITHVIGGDEGVPDVDNAASTNGHAIANLAAATAAANVLGVAPKPDWERVRQNIPIPKSPGGVIRQYATYSGEPVPQADANFLVWPLQLITDPKEIRGNLDYYASRSHGISVPTIALPVLAIVYQRIGETEKAFDLFKNGFKSVKFPPFGVIAEYPNEQNPYFVTGAGNILQIMLYGFGGLDITDRGLVQKPTKLPAGWNSLRLTRIGPDQLTYVVK